MCGKDCILFEAKDGSLCGIFRSKYYKYRDEVCTMIYESFPNAAITCNASGSQPPIGAFEISLIFGMQVSFSFPSVSSLI